MAESVCSRFLSHKISNVIAPSCEIDKPYMCVECRLLPIDVKKCAKKILCVCMHVDKCVEEVTRGLKLNLFRQKEQVDINLY